MHVHGGMPPGMTMVFIVFTFVTLIDIGIMLPIMMFMKSRH